MKVLTVSLNALFSFRKKLKQQLLQSSIKSSQNFAFPRLSVLIHMRCPEIDVPQ